MPPAKRAPEAQTPAKPTTPAEQPPAEPTPAEQPAKPTPAAILVATAAAVIPYMVGHTGNNKIHLCIGYWSPWAATLAEYIGAHIEGVQFYTGKTRPRAEDGKDWAKVDLRDKHNLTHEQVKAWYNPMDRLDAARRHAAGCEAMGWDPRGTVATFRPDRDDMWAIKNAADPIAEAKRLAAQPAKASKAADGLNREKRDALDSAMRTVVKRVRAGQKFGGLLSDLDEYTEAQITASAERVTKDADDAATVCDAIADAL